MNYPDTRSRNPESSADDEGRADNKKRTLEPLTRKSKIAIERVIMVIHQQLGIRVVSCEMTTLDGDVHLVFDRESDPIVVARVNGTLSARGKRVSEVDEMRIVAELGTIEDL